MNRLIKCLIIIWLLFFTLVFFMGATRHVDLNGPKIKGIPRELIVFLSTFVKNVTQFTEITKPMLIRRSYTLKNGFNYDSNYNAIRDYLLISTYDDVIGQAIVKLVRIRDGKIIYKWLPNIDSLNTQFNKSSTYGLKNSLNKLNTKIMHPFLENDGSLIFGAGFVFKVDKNSKLIWSNLTSCHHTLEQDAEGNIWICSYNKSSINSEKYQIMDDAIQQISAKNGQLLFDKSVFEILMENGYGRGHFFINPLISYGSTYLDYMHLNDVQPGLEDSRYWKRGDVFLSLRHQNLVLLYRPSTNKILWLQNGPWLKQHDVNVIDSCRIGIYGNNIIDAKFSNDKEQLIDGHNNQYIFDFSTNECTTPYDLFFKSANISTYTGGRTKILFNNDIFVEESNSGRFIFGNHKEEIWSYIEKIDDNRIATISWSRYITEEEFNQLTFIN